MRLLSPPPLACGAPPPLLLDAPPPPLLDEEDDEDDDGTTATDRCEDNDVVWVGGWIDNNVWVDKYEDVMVDEAEEVLG